MKKEVFKPRKIAYVNSIPKSEKEMDLEVAKKKLKIKLANFGESKNACSKKVH